MSALRVFGRARNVFHGVLLAVTVSMAALPGVSSAVVVPTVPAPPTALVATAGPARATVSWQAPATAGSSPVSGYVVLYATSITGPWTRVATVAASQRQASISGLLNGVQYRVRVYATNAAGSGQPAGVWVTPRTTAYGVQSLAAVAGDASVALTWSPPSSNGGAAVTDYRIQFSSDAGATFELWPHAPSTETTATVTGLTNGTSYQFKVSAVNEAGPGTGTVVSAMPIGRPAAVSNLAASVDVTSVSLTWTPAADVAAAPVAGYAVSYSTDGTSWQTWPHAPATATLSSITGLTSGTPYQFKVVAVNAVGESDPAVISATPRTVPGAPSNLALTSGSGSLGATWTAPSFTGGAAITDYVIRVSSDGTNWSVWSDPVSSATSATISGLGVGAQYYVRVAAVNAAGVGAYVQATGSTSAGVPSAPTSVLAVRGNKSIAVSWLPPASTGGATIGGYVVQYQSGSSWVNAALVPPAASGRTSTNVTGLTNGVSYNLRVYAVNSVGWGTAATASATPATVPNVPAFSLSNLATSGVTGSVVISWSPPASNGASIGGYAVRWKTGAETWESRLVVPLQVTTTVGGLTRGSVYTFQMVAVNAVGSSSWSAAKSITVSATPAPGPR